mmetsp:Transcript_47488/g.118664  ORF Transcript_47488/g.118664 Transcript_47488/m.118664 type:complete len:239 (+) Transcript_47488:156-872(+)
MRTVWCSAALVWACTTSTSPSRCGTHGTDTQTSSTSPPCPPTKTHSSPHIGAAMSCCGTHAHRLSSPPSVLLATCGERGRWVLGVGGWRGAATGNGRSSRGRASTTGSLCWAPLSAVVTRGAAQPPSCLPRPPPPHVCSPLRPSHTSSSSHTSTAGSPCATCASAAGAIGATPVLSRCSRAEIEAPHRRTSVVTKRRPGGRGVGGLPSGRNGPSRPLWRGEGMRATPPQMKTAMPKTR